jgi:hypothetical protein
MVMVERERTSAETGSQLAVAHQGNYRFEVVAMILELANTPYDSNSDDRMGTCFHLYNFLYFQ